MAANFGPGGAPVALNGTTWVPVVTAPGAGKQRQILSITPRNKDSVQHVYESRKVVSATPYELFSAAVDAAVTGQPAKVGQLISNCVVLSGANDSFEVRTSEATASVESEVDVVYFEVP